jgi:branched-chain amino acid aminotransferase
MLQKYDNANDDIRYSVNGKLFRRNEPGLSPFDSVVQGGDGVWEGLRLYQGRIFRLTEHLSRLRNSAKALAFAAIPTDEEITAAIRETLIANRMFDGVHIRLTLTRGVKITSGMDPRLNKSGPTLIVLPEFKPPVYDKSGLKLAATSVRRPGPDVMDPKIHHNNLINSILGKIEATLAGADDALMLDSRGFVAETNATHLFLVSKGVLKTPRTVACPEGITRDVVLEIAGALALPSFVEDLSLVDFYRADEVFCTGTMGELAPVTSIDSRTIGSGRPGPITARLSEAFAARVAVEGTMIVTKEMFGV